MFLSELAVGLLGLVIFAVQIAILLYVLSLLRRTAEGVEHIGATLDRAMARAFPTDRLAPETPVEWVGRPREIGGREVVPGSRGVVVDHGGAELTVTFEPGTFSCLPSDVQPSDP